MSKRHNRRHVLQEEQRSTLVTLYDEGVGLNRLAEEMGTTRSKIYNTLLAENIDPRFKRPGSRKEKTPHTFRDIPAEIYE